MREIQDSDDELEDLEFDVPLLKPSVASVQHDNNHVSLQQHGTGSTESLKQALQTEHHAQFRSQPSQVELETASASLEHPCKRRKTSSIVLSPEKNPITGDMRSKLVSDGPLSGETGHTAAEVDTGTHGEPIWNLKGTMREDYSHHEPMELFPDPSSTIANTTQTQLRVLDAACVPMTFSSYHETEVLQSLLPPEASVPWSDLMKFTPGDPSGSSEPSRREGPTLECITASSVQTVTEMEASTSQHSLRISSNPLKGSPLRHKTANEDSHLLISTDKPTEERSTELIPPEALNTGTAASKSSIHSTPRRKAQINLLYEHDDVFHIGLPQERYNPRPSRSRSLKVDHQENIDYSVIPERVGRVSKRRKTTDVPSSVKIPTTPQKIKQICDMGFTPATTKKALKNHNGDVTSTVEWLVINCVGEDELASHSMPKTTPITSGIQDTVLNSDGLQVIMHNLEEYRKDKSVTSPSAPLTAYSTDPLEKDLTCEHHEHLKESSMTSPKVLVVIPKNSSPSISLEGKKSSKPAKRKAKRRKTTLDPPEPMNTSEPTGLLEVVLEKRKGRGRPKQATEHKPPVDVVQDHPSQDELETPQIESLQSAKFKVTLGPAAIQSIEPPLHDVVTEHIAKVRDDTVETPITPLSKTDKTSKTKQSSELTRRSVTTETQGRVPYRVGLSKRARIAPLLRVLKK